MIRYLDTSLFVASFTKEARTGAVQTWLRKQNPEELAISAWVVTEFSAALSIKLRTGQIEGGHRVDALAQFAQMAAHSLTVLPVSQMQFATAARFADQHRLGLRAGDALHLAIVASEGATLYTLDKKLAAAGTALGIRTQPI